MRVELSDRYKARIAPAKGQVAVQKWARIRPIGASERFDSQGVEGVTIDIIGVRSSDEHTRSTISIVKLRPKASEIAVRCDAI